ncbi:MarR family winged helix-turn-helix transcriptional regulator [Sphingomonas fuzhouensis]|uniref:MarR family winged helix-turn-helix transcriptional regulator n=1 Tax=Sphingomonas fuzhouensis TaxID=3106033 RepID=UPI002AFFFE68|nr:MarR family transcriptional regulator [Sphingomonas sp. SGZ-02]
MDDPISDRDYRALAGFRRQLRTFLSFSEEAAAQAGITAQQHQALLALRAAPDRALLIGELAEHLRLRPHSASGLVDRLEKLGLVRRATGVDRRRVPVTLTEQGTETIATLAIAHRAELRRLRPLLMDMLSAL